jgi:NAD(P)-dependent dehydrogenase (short-subunit alcohol dehydrogenase family)
MGQLQGKVALITGAGMGIGRSSALLFAREGAKVTVADIEIKGGEETAQMINKNGGQSIFVKTDVTKSAEVQALVKKAIDTYGSLDCAFNNAGVSQREPTTTADSSEADWEWIININLKGVWLCMKYEIEQMLKQGRGSIVNASSLAGIVALQGYPLYTASKHGVSGLTKVAALDYAKNGIRINAVCPGLIKTRMTQTENETQERILMQDIALKQPLGRLGLPEEVGQAALWLCSDASSFVTGHLLSVDGGWVIQ